MGKPKKSDKKREYNGTRSIAPEVFKDKKAGNLLSFKKKEYDTVGKGNKTRNRKVDQGLIKPQKKARVYTEKELGIPKLNTALNPVGVKVKGKKGKKFVTDDKMALILAEVNEEQNAVRASKLERARQLEEIRNLKRQEIEEKEQENKDRLERKKNEIKGKKNRGSKSNKKSMDAPSDKPIKVSKGDGKPKKGVRFA